MEKVQLSQAALSLMGWASIRAKRDQLISNTDWTQMPDSPLSAETKSAFAQYRQDLRELPQKYQYHDDVIWPVKPE